jgi:hypothetical protein
MYQKVVKTAKKAKKCVENSAKCKRDSKNESKSALHCTIVIAIAIC